MNRLVFDHAKPPVWGIVCESMPLRSRVLRSVASTYALAVAVAACDGSLVEVPEHDLRPLFSLHGLNPAATIQLCHDPAHGGQLIEVAGAAREAHLAHGDYVATLRVNHLADLSGHGIHFGRIGDALKAARDGRLSRGELTAAACRITIDVAAGSFRGSFDASADPDLEALPLYIDVPDITLHGALQLDIDEAGRPTGSDGRDGEVTTILPDRPLVFLPNTEAMIVIVGHPGGSAGHGAVIEGLDFQSGRTDGLDGGMGMIALRVHGLVVRGNRFGRGLTSAGDFRSTSARVEGNYAERLGASCSFCLAGPGEYAASDNRLVNGGLGGIYVSAALQHMPFSLGASPVAPVEPEPLPASAAVTAMISNNEIRGHLRRPVGFAVRVLAIGPSSSSVAQATSVLLDGNDMTGNTFGLIVDGGFPQPSSLLRGDISVTLRGNTISASCQNDLLVAFTRHTGALGLTTNPYLARSTYELELGGDLSWDDAWFGHPPGFDNTLIVDGQPIGNGVRHSYDPVGCTGP